MNAALSVYLDTRASACSFLLAFLQKLLTSFLKFSVLSSATPRSSARQFIRQRTRNIYSYLFIFISKDKPMTFILIHLHIVISNQRDNKAASPSSDSKTEPRSEQQVNIVVSSA